MTDPEVRGAAHAPVPHEARPRHVLTFALLLRAAQRVADDAAREAAESAPDRWAAADARDIISHLAATVRLDLGLLSACVGEYIPEAGEVEPWLNDYGVLRAEAAWRPERAGGVSPS